MLFQRVVSLLRRVTQSVKPTSAALDYEQQFIETAEMDESTRAMIVNNYLSGGPMSMQRATRYGAKVSEKSTRSFIILLECYSFTVRRQQ